MILSYSHIQTYERCPKRYMYTYVDKIPQPLHRSLSFGTSIHNALYKYLHIYRSIRNNQQQHSLFDAPAALPGLDVLLECLDASWIDAGYFSQEEMYQRKQEGIDILSNFYSAMGTPEILFLEKSFSTHFDTISIRGRYDRVDITSKNSLEIIDYKTGKLRTAEECEQDMQMHLYQKALGEQFPGYSISTTLYFLEHNIKIQFTHSQESITKTQRTIKSIGNAINQGLFEPTPEVNKCHSCPYNKICPQAL